MWGRYNLTGWDLCQLFWGTLGWSFQWHLSRIFTISAQWLPCWSTDILITVDPFQIEQTPGTAASSGYLQAFYFKPSPPKKKEPSFRQYVLVQWYVYIYISTYILYVYIYICIDNITNKQTNGHLHIPSSDQHKYNPCMGFMSKSHIPKKLLANISYMDLGYESFRWISKPPELRPLLRGFTTLPERVSINHWAIGLHPRPPQHGQFIDWRKHLDLGDQVITIYYKNVQSPKSITILRGHFLLFEVIRCHEIYTVGWLSHSVPSFLQLLTVSESISSHDWINKHLSTLV